VGLCLSVAWGAGFALSAPVGHLADRVGARRTAITLSLATAGALALAATPVAVAGVLPFGLVVTGYGVAQSALGGTRAALLVRLVPASGLVAARARLQVAVNAGLGAGAALGGLALLMGTPAAFRTVLCFDAVTFLLAAAVLTRLPRDGRGAPAPAPDGAPATTDRRSVLQDRRYLAVTGLSAVLHLYLPTLSVVLPLYLARRTAAPSWAVALVFVVNTTGVLLLQVPAARAAPDLAGAARALRRAGWLLLGSCLAFAAVAVPASPAGAVAVLVPGAALQVMGEVLLAAGGWQVGFALADARRPGQWQGVFAAAPPLARAAGPLALTALVLTWSGPGWLVLGLLLAAAGQVMGWVALPPGRTSRRGRRRRPRAVPAASG